VSLPSTDVIRENVRTALAEDVGTGDITAQLVPADRQATATVVCREQAVMAGMSWFNEVFRQIDSSIDAVWLVNDTEPMQPGQSVCTLSGPARGLLTGERTALNFLQTLSAVATHTRRYVDAVAATGVRILDTRKTLPGLRQAQKYAVRCGGGHNHRMGLYDAYLIKENHIAAAGSLTEAVVQAAANAADIKVEVEVENLAQLQEAIRAGAHFVLLDNFDLAQIREAVKLNQGAVQLEVSGGITLDNVRAYADTGVDFISVGELTKSIRAVDFSMRIQDQ
jgi:nicotinate-nucleotide pyrophosphorylase (carboxylating)